MKSRIKFVQDKNIWKSLKKTTLGKIISGVSYNRDDLGSFCFI